MKVKENDIILICSDGLSTMLEDDEICNIASAGGFSLEDRASMLVEAAKKNGGFDNISVIIIDI